MIIRDMKQLKFQGISTDKYTFIPTGYKTLDYAINDLMSSTLTVVTGRPSEGKSTFVHTVLLNAIDKGNNVLLVDGEHPQEILLSQLFRKAIGNEPTLYDVRNFNKIELLEPKEHIQEMLDKWISNLHICSKYQNDLSNFDKVFELFNEYVSTRSIDFIVMDNLMSLVDSTQAEMNAKQSKFMKKCSSLAKAMNVPILIVAHPNTGAMKGKKMDYYQISGTADIPNLADVVLQIIKDPTDDNDVVLSHGMIGILKNRYGSSYDDIYLAFDNETRSLCEVFNGEYQTISYDWRNEGKQQSPF